jgi:hypothetical protein
VASLDLGRDRKKHTEERHMRGGDSDQMPHRFSVCTLPMQEIYRTAGSLCRMRTASQSVANRFEAYSVFTSKFQGRALKYVNTILSHNLPDNECAFF